MNEFDGEVHQTDAKQWVFRIFRGGLEVCGGGGFDSEDEACNALSAVMATYMPDE